MIEQIPREIEFSLRVSFDLIEKKFLLVKMKHCSLEAVKKINEYHRCYYLLFLVLKIII